MNETMKRQLAATARDAVPAPRAALITVSADADGRPRVDVPVALVCPGDVVVWSAASSGEAPWRVVFGAMRPELAAGPDFPGPDGGPPGARAGCPPGQDHGRLSPDGPTLASAPLQAARMRISRDAPAGAYRYGLQWWEDLGPDRDPPRIDLDLVMVVMRGPRVEEGSEPVN